MLRLDRDGPAIEMDVQVVFPEERTIRLRFDGVVDVHLIDFNEQNVLFDLKVDESGDGLWEASLESSYGLAGRFRYGSVGVM
jgi:hypothetical protein